MKRIHQEEIKRLKRDIFEIVVNNDETTKKIYQIQYNMEKVVWSGNSMIVDYDFKGFLNCINISYAK